MYINSIRSTPRCNFVSRKCVMNVWLAPYTEQRSWSSQHLSTFATQCSCNTINDLRTSWENSKLGRRNVWVNTADMSRLQFPCRGGQDTCYSSRTACTHAINTKRHKTMSVNNLYTNMIYGKQCQSMTFSCNPEQKNIPLYIHTAQDENNCILNIYIQVYNCPIAGHIS